MEIEARWSTKAKTLFARGELALSQGRLVDAHAAWHSFALEQLGIEQSLSGQIPSPVWPSKLRHDFEQLCHLRERGIVSGRYEKLIDIYRSITSNSISRSPERPITLESTQYREISPVLNQIYNLYLPSALKDGALNPKIDAADIYANFKEYGFAVCDDFLNPTALAEIRRQCLESTIWFDARGLYLGAYLREGLSSPLLYQISDEAMLRLHQLLSGLRLRQLWAYRYDGNLPGTFIHADPGTININLWITPDSANLDPESGGLVMYSERAPQDWSWQEYNRDQPKIEKYLLTKKAQKIRIPYRSNRAIIFDAKLFHATDEYFFDFGFENRRTNVTFLFENR